MDLGEIRTDGRKELAASGRSGSTILQAPSELPLQVGMAVAAHDKQAIKKSQSRPPTAEGC